MRKQNGNSELRVSSDFRNKTAEHRLSKQNERGRDDRSLLKARADSETDDTGSPKTRGGRESFYGITLCNNDCTGAEKAESRNNGGTDPRNISRKRRAQV